VGNSTEDLHLIGDPRQVLQLAWKGDAPRFVQTDILEVHQHPANLVAFGHIACPQPGQQLFPAICPFLGRVEHQRSVIAE
jgi:hypothetical protein